jgi:transposase InsO family protein
MNVVPGHHRSGGRSFRLCPPTGLPFRVELIKTDNGAEFQAAFHWHVTDRGIRHVYIRPATPRLNGKVERSHRIDDEEF